MTERSMSRAIAAVVAGVLALTAPGAIRSSATTSAVVNELGSGFAASVAASDTHSLAVRPDGAVWSWGDNHLGQLGDGTTTSRSAPIAVGSLVGPHAAVSAGLAHSLALNVDGTVWAWGLNSDGQLGDGVAS